METIDYRRLVRTMNDLSTTDRAVVIARMRENGQIVITNCGDLKAREEIYNRLGMVNNAKEYRGGIVI